MNPVNLLIPWLLAIPLLMFWAWMLRDMMNNPYLTDNARYYWMIAFVLANVFAAAWYYGAEYKHRH